MSGRRFALAAATLLAAPATGQACAVCFSGSDESRLAFIVTTVFLTLLPLGLIGGVVTWIALRVRRQSLSEAPGTQLDQAPRSSVRP